MKQEAYSTHFKQLVDLKESVGKELGISPWVTITQDKIDAFGNLTEDMQWIHVDPEKSKMHSPYKKTVAHGFLVLSFASKFTYDTYSLGDVVMGVNYGLNKVRFPNATKSDALVRGRVSLMTYDEIPGGARFMLKVVFEIKGATKPACVAEFIGQAYTAAKDEEITQKAPKNTAEKANEPEIVLYRKEGKVGVITLNRPERYNAVTPELVEALNVVLRKVREDDEVRAVVLTGAGRGFCAGADMASFGKISPEDAREYITTAYQTLLRNFFTLRKPVIGAINGTAAGVGASIALACDLRIMTAKSSLLYAFVNIGLGPDGGASWLLARQVGYSKALQIAMEGEKIRGEECLHLGLTNKLVDQEALLQTAMDWANKLADKPTIAIGITKEDMMYAMTHDLYDTVAFEAERQLAALASSDLIEGVSAFVEKRPARFTGK